MRSNAHWPLVAALTASVLAACDRQAAPPSAAPSPSASEPSAPAGTAAPEGPWRLEASATAGAALVFGDSEGVERLRLICRPGPAEFIAQAPDVVPIGSEERFTLGFGDELFTLVADVASGLPFVEARTPLTPDLVAALRSGRPVAANYGATNLGPHPAPAPQVADAFANACEQSLSGPTRTD